MHNNLLDKLSLQQLRETITIREEIEELERELDSIVDGQPSTKAPARRKKRRFSTAARTKLSRGNGLVVEKSRGFPQRIRCTIPT